MIFIRINLDNSLTGDATCYGAYETIASSGYSGYKLKGFIPASIGPSGKILAMDLVFDRVENKVIYDFETVYADNNPRKTAEFSEYEELIKKHVDEGADFCGFVPIKIGPSGKILEMELVFAR